MVKFNNKNKIGSIDEDTIIYEGKEFSVDLYIEALGMKDRIATVAKNGYYLSDICPPNLKKLNYKMNSDSEFQKIVKFIESNIEAIASLSTLFVHYKYFDRHFRIVSESLKRQNPSPFLIQIKSELFDKFSSNTNTYQ